MMSVLIQLMIIRYVGIMIQITAIAEQTRRFLAMSYKTSNNVAFRQSAVGQQLMLDDDDDDDDSIITY